MNKGGKNMKKKIIKLLICAFVFLLPISNANAAVDYSYKNAYINIKNLTNGTSTWNITSSKTHTATKINNSTYGFWIHQAYKDPTYIHAYCLNVGKTADTTSCPTLDEKNLTASNTGLSDAKIKLLKKLLANATYHKGNISSSSGTEYSNSDKYAIIATQILVWEVVEGARTSFDKIAPNKYNESNSAYKMFVKKNSAVNTEYENIIKNIQSRETPAATTGTVFAETSTQVIPWNGSVYKKTFKIGEYTSCTSSSSSVNTTVSGSKLTVSSKSKISSDVTISCEYSIGTTLSSYKYYDFTCGGDFQDLIRGDSGYTYKESFKVKTVDRNVKIVKYDDSGKQITGAKFLLKCAESSKCGSDSFTYDLTSSTSKILTLAKSGIYTLTETTTPSNKQKIPDGTQVSINVENGTASVSGGGGLVSVVNGDTITINVINTSEYFNIIKTDANGSAIKGATFQIRKGNTALKFSWDGQKYVYNTSGTENLVQSSLSIYPVAGLPDGTYNLVEVAVPSPYVLASNEKERTKSFTVTNGFTANITVKNYTSNILINKIGKQGAKLEGVSFYLLDSTKTKKIKSTMTSSGIYTYSSDQNSGVESYTTNANGQISISSLPEGTYYFQEYNTGNTGYSVPDGDEAYTKITISITSSGVKINGSTSNQITISNAKNEFSFYKVDENGKYLTGGLFKIQKYNKTKNKYEDLTVKKVEDSSSTSDTYKIDSTSDLFTFSVNNGVARFIDMESSARYRIVELQAPDGYEISTIEGEDRIVIEIDSSGYVKTSTTMINKNIVKDTEAEASAELIVNIQTGQKRLRYVLIISVLLIIIISLLIINKKRKIK
jgi:hypothetical protein